MTAQGVPAHWIELEIGDLAEVIGGGTPKAGDPTNFAEPGTSNAWLTPADLSGYKNKYISHGARDLSPKGLNSISARLMPRDSVLFSSRAPIGYVAVASNEISTNQGFKSFVFPADIAFSFAYYFLRSIRDLAESRGTGTTFKEISGANARKLPFLIAPLAEQEQIAAKLDELLAQVDTIKTRLDAIPAILKRFWQSVLAAAVSGRLTEEWRAQNPMLESKGQLSELRDRRSGLSSLIGKKEKPLKRQLGTGHLPDILGTWHYSYIDPFLDVERSGMKTGPFGSLLKKSEHQSQGVPVLGIENIDNGNFSSGSKIHITEDKAEELASYDICAGDLIISRSGSVGDICVVPGNLGVTRFSTNIMRISFLKNSIDPKFFCHLFLGSPIVLQQIADLCKGSTRLFLNQKILSSIKYPIPPLEEQSEIVRRVEQLFAFAGQIEQRMKDAQTRVNHLTQSILAKAFRGELTSEWWEQNPDLINGENSAEALLERIKAERADTAPKKRTRKK